MLCIEGVMGYQIDGNREESKHDKKKYEAKPCHGKLVLSQPSPGFHPQRTLLVFIICSVFHAAALLLFLNPALLYRLLILGSMKA